MKGASLTSREREVLNALAEGLSRHETAELLGVAPTTVRTHLTNLYRKLGLPKRREREGSKHVSAIRAAYEQGLVLVPPEGKAGETERQSAQNTIKRLGHELTAARHELKRLRKIESDHLDLTRPGITDAQRAYLWAFDKYVKAWASGDELIERRTRKAMTLAAGGFLSPELIQMSHHRAGNPLDRIAKTLNRLDTAA